MKKFFTGAAVAVLMVAATGANALTQTFEATITDVTGGAELLAEMGIASGGTLTARMSFDTDLSGPASPFINPFFTYDYLSSTYSEFSVIGPSKTVDAVASDGINHGVFSRDGISEGTREIDDVVTITSVLYSTHPSSYYAVRVQSSDSDETKWSRTNPITASLLNSFEIDDFLLGKSVTLRNGGIERQELTSTSIEWAEVSAVPLPAGLPLLLAGLGAFGIASRRRS